MEAEIEIKEALLKVARSLGTSPNPEMRIAAAKEEIRLDAELRELRKRAAKRQPVMAG